MTYSAAVSLSGGKDSAYLLYLFKEVYKKDVIAISIIHPFMSEVAINNIKHVVKKLDVPHIEHVVDPEMFAEFIKAGVENWHDELTGCQLCGYFYKTATMNLATKAGVKYLICGEDPTQLGSNAEIMPWEIPEYASLFIELFREAGKETAYYPLIDTDVLCVYPYVSFGYDYREIMKKVQALNLIPDPEPKKTNCSVFHYFAAKAFKENDRFPHQRFIDRARNLLTASVVDQVVETKENQTPAETTCTIMAYRRLLEALTDQGPLPLSSVTSMFIDDVKKGFKVYDEAINR